MLFTALLEIVKEILREARGWAFALTLVAGVVAAMVMSATSDATANKAWGVGLVFSPGCFLAAVAGLRLDKRRNAEHRK